MSFVRTTVLMFVLGVFAGGCAVASDQPGQPEPIDLAPLPAAVANNAVVSIATKKGTYLASFNGLSEGKKWNHTVAHTYLLAPGASSWEQVNDVPGEHGRLASIAVSLKGRAFVFGGYTVAEDHTEVSLPLVHAFDPITGSFERLADMPVPVDDAMALVYSGRYIYLISGWHDTANVNLVQRYDVLENSWIQATAYPGEPVFGHSGGIVGNELVVCGGVKIKTHSQGPREFVMNTDCFAGTIRPDDTRRIDWRTIEPMPGPARYRMAATGSEHSGGVYFLGGSDNPYNYNGIGYNQVPSQPVGAIYHFDLAANQWREVGQMQRPSMDHRGLLEIDGGFVTVGGMLANQTVTKRVVKWILNSKSN